MLFQQLIGLRFRRHRRIVVVDDIALETAGIEVVGVTTHPGIVLKEDFLKPMEISANQLALRTRMPATRVGQILHARRGVSVDTALRLARYFGTSAEFWLNLQAAYDLSKARLEFDGVIQRDVEPLGLEARSA